MAHGGYTARKAAFKQIDAAIGNYETAMVHLLNLREKYKSEHPEIAENAERIMGMTLKIQDITVAFRKSF